MSRQLSESQLIRKLEALDVAPFRDLLAMVLEHQPDTDALTALAKYPSRWIKVVETLAKLAGYKDNLRLEHRTVGEMCDAEVEARFAQLLRDAQTPTQTTRLN